MPLRIVRVRTMVACISYRAGAATVTVAVDTPTGPPARPPLCTNPEHISALRRKAVTFTQLVEARRDARRTPHGGDPRTYQGCYLELRESYQDRVGPILEERFTADHGQGALVTGHGELEIMVNPTDPVVSKRIVQCEKLAREAHRLLRRSDLRVCTLDLFAAAAFLVLYAPPTVAPQTAAAIAARREQINRDLAFIDDALEQTRLYYLRAAQLNAEIAYLIGIAVGLVLLLVLAWFGNGALQHWSLKDFDITRTTTTFVMGGIGALVSVMSRLHSGKLALNYEAGWMHIGLMGIFRPFIGGVSATVIFFLLVSQLVTTIKATAGTPEIYFDAVIGFFAGFSERFAQDMLARGPGGSQSGRSQRGLATSGETAPG